MGSRRLEIHAELTTLNTKMFCGCKLESRRRPQYAHVPHLFGPAWRAPRAEQGRHREHRARRFGHQLRYREALMFYRKNYMYPDMAKNFQTTQGPVAFCMRGHSTLRSTALARKSASTLMA